MKNKMKNKAVLVVEDDATIRENLQEFLESENFTVYAASNGKDGLARIRELGGHCLVLLDLQMPKMNGEQLLDELIHDSNPEVAATSIVIITARVDPIKYAVRGYLKKPLDLDLLLATVNKFI